MSTTRRAKIVILLILLGGFSLGSYPLWTIEVAKGESGTELCLIKDWNSTESKGAEYKHWNTAVLVFGTLIIPGIIIAVITVIIVVILTHATRRRESMQTDGQVNISLNVRY